MSNVIDLWERIGEDEERQIKEAMDERLGMSARINVNVDQADLWLATLLSLKESKETAMAAAFVRGELDETAPAVRAILRDAGASFLERMIGLMVGCELEIIEDGRHRHVGRGAYPAGLGSEATENRELEFDEDIPF